MFQNKFSLFLLTIGIATGSIYAKEPIFHIKNKSNDAIEISIWQDNISLTKNTTIRIPKGGSFKGGDKGTTDPDINKATDLILYYCPTAGTCKNNLEQQFTVSFPADRTIYIKFDKQNRLMPQKGSSEISK